MQRTKNLKKLTVMQYDDPTTVKQLFRLITSMRIILEIIPVEYPTIMELMKKQFMLVVSTTFVCLLLSLYFECYISFPRAPDNI